MGTNVRISTSGLNRTRRHIASNRSRVSELHSHMQNSGSQRPELHDRGGGNDDSIVSFSNSPRPGCTGATPGSIQPPTAPVSSKPPTKEAITGDLTSAELVDKVGGASTSWCAHADGTFLMEMSERHCSSAHAPNIEQNFEGATSATFPPGAFAVSWFTQLSNMISWPSN